MAPIVRLEKGIIPTKDTKLTLGGVISIPPIAIGCWSWGDKKVWNWTPKAEKDAKDAFDTAYKLGISFYDTAESYGDGESERIVQRLKKDYRDDDKILIATKYFPHSHRTEFPDVLLSALKDSLSRLGGLSVDLYQIHAPVHPAEIEVVADALADAYESGLVRAVGVSNYGIKEVERMYQALKKRNIQLASNQVNYSLMRRIPETSGLIQLCHSLGVVVLAYSPLCMGLLTGKYNAEGPFPGLRGKNFIKYDVSKLSSLLGELSRLSNKYNCKQTAIALNWCICKGTVPLGGAKTGEQVVQNAEALGGFCLSDEDIACLDKFSFIGSNNRSWQHG